jgi:pre-mRNA-splicing factor 38A
MEKLINFVLENENHKYVTAVGLFYLRLTGKAVEIYECLEAFYNDNRKIRYRKDDGKYMIMHMDELVDELLHNSIVCDVILPRI